MLLCFCKILLTACLNLIGVCVCACVCVCVCELLSCSVFENVSLINSALFINTFKEIWFTKKYSLLSLFLGRLSIQCP